MRWCVGGVGGGCCVGGMCRVGCVCGELAPAVLGVQRLHDGGMNPHWPVRLLLRSDAQRHVVRRLVRPPKAEAEPHSQGQVLVQRMFTAEPVRVGKRQRRHCGSLDIAEMARARATDPRTLLRISDASTPWKSICRFVGAVSGLCSTAVRLKDILCSVAAFSGLWSTADYGNSPSVKQPTHGRITRMLNRAGVQFRQRNLWKHRAVFLDI